MDQGKRIQALQSSLRERILVLDGSMGALLQSKDLQEKDYRGERFADHKLPLKNNVDVLNFTNPDLVREIHDSYFEAGADIGTTNTFSSTSVTQEDFDLAGYCYELNLAGAQLARESADAWNKETPEKPRWVAGSLGPTNKTSSVAIEVSNPALRAIDFDPLKNAYAEAARGLLDGGADIILIETIFDTLNAKAALMALEELWETTKYRRPIILSWTATDLSGRNLSGQTIDAFWNSVRHGMPLAIGLNCSFGADALRPNVLDLARVAEVPIAVYPNAGLPNDLGEFDETPQVTAQHINDWAESGLVNIVGGCCGTTPEHIRQISAAVAAHKPRVIPRVERRMRLAGIDSFEVGS